MELVTFPLLAFTPGIFWLWFFIRRAVYRPAPRRLLVQTFLLGMVSTIPAGIINAIFVDDIVLNDTASLASVAHGMLFVVGPAEETCKFLAVRLLAYRSPYFDEPGDGLVYSTAASLGFASLENLLYILQFGPAVMLVRAPLSTAGHVVMGSIWGYALGEQVRAGKRRAWQTFAGVAGGAIAHGFFNIMVFAYPPAAIVLVFGGVSWTLGRFAWARRSSPFRYRRNYPSIECPNCNQSITIISHYCRFCGVPVAGPQAGDGELICSYCGHHNRSDARFCIQCGDRLLR